jgi:hypothetical protein
MTALSLHFVRGLGTARAPVVPLRILAQSGLTSQSQPAGFLWLKVCTFEMSIFTLIGSRLAQSVPAAPASTGHTHPANALLRGARRHLLRPWFRRSPCAGILSQQSYRQSSIDSRWVRRSRSRCGRACSACVLMLSSCSSVCAQPQPPAASAPPPPTAIRPTRTRQRRRCARTRGACRWRGGRCT